MKQKFQCFIMILKNEKVLPNVYLFFECFQDVIKHVERMYYMTSQTHRQTGQ